MARLVGGWVCSSGCALRDLRSACGHHVVLDDPGFGQLPQVHVSFARRLPLFSFVAVFGAAALVLLAHLFGLGLLRVSSGSMAPTAQPGDWVVMQRMQGQVAAWAHRNDIAVFEFPFGTDQLAIKRIVGVPGDIVITGSTSVSVNGQPFPALNAQRVVSSPASSRPIPGGALVLLGDNAAASIDSRWFGPVPGQEIVGRVLAILPQRAVWIALTVGAALFLLLLVHGAVFRLRQPP